MSLSTRKLKEIFVGGGLIGEDEFQDAQHDADRFRRPVLEAIVGKGVLDERFLMEAIADYFKVPIYQKGEKIERFGVISEQVAKELGVFVLGETEDSVRLGMTDVTNVTAQNYVERLVGKPATVVLLPRSDFNELLKWYKRSIGEEFEGMIQEYAKQLVAGGTEKRDVVLAKKLPVITIMDSVLEHAIANKASDIHIEPAEEKVYIRYRIDGVLYDVAELPRQLHSALVARVKVLSSLQLDVHRTPQDGRFKISTKNSEGTEEEVSFRVSVIPTLRGEKIVMRVLLSSERFSNFAALGIEGRDLEVIQRTLDESGSLILVVGPTGSGKTTTLYTIMQQVNKPEVNILTVEDPIEYDIPRVSQTQVNERAGLTFASALRSFLRQDPDIIMVGEIRDAETTELVVHATLTGHTVLSTLHTDDAPSAIPRLLDLGTEEFLLASTLHVVVSQRLVRRICTDCIERVSVEPAQKKILQERLARSNPAYVKNAYQFSGTVYRGAGCDSCNHSGYKGRIGIYEVLEVTPEIVNLILEKTSADKIREVALTQGYTTMLEDGVKKVERGVTTMEELLRVTPS